MADGVFITMDELANMAGQYFYGLSQNDIPEKLWVDSCPALGQSYLRACFDGTAKAANLVRLSALAEAIDDRFGTQLVCVVYPQDYPWPQIEAWNAALNARKWA